MPKREGGVTKPAEPKENERGGGVLLSFWVLLAFLLVYFWCTSSVRSPKEKPPLSVTEGGGGKIP